MRSAFLTLTATFSIFMFSFATAKAATVNIPIENPTFEENLGVFPYQNGYAPGWSATNGNYGTQNDTGLGSVPIAPPPGGIHVLFLYLNGPCTVYQNTTTIAPDTTYTLDAYVGRRQDDAFAQGIVSLSTSSGTLLATSGVVQPPFGDWQDVTVRFTTGSSGPAIGKTLQIDLTYASAPHPSQVDFDNVSLTATTPAVPVPLPSPAIAGLTLMGGIGLVRLFGRRRADHIC